MGVLEGSAIGQLPPSGGAVTVSAGTTGRLPKYTSATALGNSNFADVGGGEFAFYNGAGFALTLNVDGITTPGHTWVVADRNFTYTAPTVNDTDADVMWGSSAANKVALHLQAKATQSVPIFKVSDSAGALLVDVGSGGVLNLAQGFSATNNCLIDGSADEIQFIIDGHSTQTNDYARIRTSAGTYIYRFGPNSLSLGNGDVRTELHGQGLGLQATSRLYFAPGGPYSNLGDIFNVADLVVNRGASKTLGLCEDGNVNTGATWRAIARTASQIGANQDNYNPGGRSYFQRWSSDASRNVTGLTFTAAQVDGQVHLIVNVGAQDIVLKHQTTSTEANRFLCSTGADITLAANQAADVIYDGTVSRWLVFKRN